MEGKGGCGKEKERDREKERGGQGCFLFSQLIDSQMSAVGFVVGVKHSGILFSSKYKQKHNTHAHGQRYSPVEYLWNDALLLWSMSLHLQYHRV